MRPLIGCVKLNCDCAWKRSDTLGGCGWLLRDSDGTSECQNIKENELVGGVAGGGFGGGSDVKRKLLYSGNCGGVVGDYGGCSDLKSEGDSKRMESQP
ncbi:hypothetical protein MTR_3g007780 [Medicago truncatula]|uniref:Uncharacterized protein n=1 Tax=Medicago truncatula TaxID=3880 RepID=G7IVC4_MEDTR|nr:hypothetical protein MTR_3g007780 [Medicago truncatula]